MAMSSSTSKDIFFREENSIQDKESSQNAEDQPISQARRKRRLLGTPRVNVEVVALTPEELTIDRLFECKECPKRFSRYQNLQLHLRVHNIDGKLKKRNLHAGPSPRRVYVCPHPECIHHDPAEALGDITGIKRHYCRKHWNVRPFNCKKCGRKYAVKDDLKAHIKKCRAYSREESIENTMQTLNISAESIDEEVPAISLHNFAPLNTNSEAFLGSMASTSSSMMIYLSPQMPMEIGEDHAIGTINASINENGDQTSNNFPLLNDEPLALKKQGVGDDNEGSNPYQYNEMNEWMKCMDNSSSKEKSLSDICYEIYEKTFGGLHEIGNPVDKNQ